MIPPRFYISELASMILTPNCFAQDFQAAKVQSLAAATMFIYPELLGVDLQGLNVVEAAAEVEGNSKRE